MDEGRVAAVRRVPRKKSGKTTMQVGCPALFIFCYLFIDLAL